MATEDADPVVIGLDAADALDVSTAIDAMTTDTGELVIRLDASDSASVRLDTVEAV